MSSSAAATTVHRLQADDLPRLAAWLYEHNRRPDGRVRCLHSEQGASVQDQLAELQALPASESLFLAAGTDSDWQGVAGCEIDAGASRAWLRGPLAADPSAAPAAAMLRLQLIRALLAELPAQHRFDAFIQTDEAPLLRAYHDAGFERRTDHHVMGASDAGRAATWPLDVIDADAGQQVQAAALHDLAFPASYLSAQALPGWVDDDHRLLVIERDAGVAGYCCVKHGRIDNEGYVDFLAVDARWQGQGLGRSLLQAAVHWTLVQRGLPKVVLTVRSDRAPALGLYRSAGFVPVAAGAHLVFERDHRAGPDA